MSPMTLPQRNGSAPVAPSHAWQQTSVQTFFTNFNWDDHSPEVQELKLASAQNSTAPLSLELSVCQFFATVNWDGNSIAAPVQSPAPPAPEPLSQPTNDITLDDFFGSF